MPLRSSITMPTIQTVILITGTNRGIGKGLVEKYLARQDHIVIAAVRDLTTSRALKDNPVAEGSRLLIVKLDATVESDAADVVKELSLSYAINHIDVVIANAGVVRLYPTVADVKIDDMLASLQPNVFGVIYLYQATRHLLNSAVNPKWVTIGSTAGSIEVCTRIQDQYLLLQSDS